MKIKYLLIVFNLMVLNCLFAQSTNDNLNILNNLIGKWQGEGSGKPGEGKGNFTFNFDLDKNILIRTSETFYPATKDIHETIHKDLMIIYSENNNTLNKAIYFDNENHTINYSLSFPNKNEIIFTSLKTNNTPIFRLTYKIIDKETLEIKFEISQDGEKFFTYVEGRAIRKD